MCALQKLAVERAKSGEIGIRPSERRRQVEEAQGAIGGFTGGRPDAYGKFQFLPSRCEFIVKLRKIDCMKDLHLHVEHFCD